MSDGSSGRRPVSDAFLSPRALGMAALGFASGLPYAVTNETAIGFLSALKIDSAKVGLLGAIGSLYAFKFLWSPLVDARAVPGLARLGRRRSWLVATQVPLAALIAGLAFVLPDSPAAPLLPFALILVAIAIVSATQDLVVNAWTVEAFPRRELGVGGAMSVGGYRAAMIIAGVVAFQIASWVNWTFAFIALAAGMGVGLAAALASREPSQVSVAERPTLAEALIAPLRDFFQRLGVGILLLLAMVFFFRLPDQLASVPQRLLLLGELGYEQEQYGVVRNGFGLAATILGSLVGGGLVVRFGILRTLLLAAVLQALSNLGFIWLALTVEPLDRAAAPWLSAPILSLLVVGGFENFCAGLVATAFVAWLMSLCRRRYAAAQYALLSGGVAFTAGIAAAASGVMVKHLSWAPFFALTALAGVPGVLLALAAARVSPRIDDGEDAEASV